ncbi:MAG TPA: hypothetical protein ENG51_12120 [Deltaproteobacteria bacterium]|nr:hypothetical protein [Deltaproteobacteria bacterium]
MKINKKLFVVIFILFFFPVNISAKSPPAAKIDGVVITWDDVDQALSQAGKKEPAEEDRKKMLDAWVARVLLAREAEKEGFLNKPEVQHSLELNRMTILSASYIKANYPKKNSPVSDDDVQKYYQTHIDVLNPQRRDVITIDVYCFKKTCDGKAMEAAANDLIGALSEKGGDNNLNKAVEGVRDEWKDLSISYPVGSTVLSNQEYYKGTPFKEKLFSASVGGAFYQKLDERDIKVVFIKEDRGRIFEEKKAFENAKKAFEQEQSILSLQNEIEKLKKKYPVEIYPYPEQKDSTDEQ